MLKRKTVFVVGAGASCEAGLPGGQELRQNIAKALDIRFQGGSKMASGSILIWHALREYARANRVDANSLLEAGWTIRNSWPLALSIDNFIDAHRGNVKIEICGKLAIGQAILDAERRSKMFVDPRSIDLLNHSKLVGTWYPKLFQLLTENVGKDDLANLFENVAFVIFNYDRCIEHFLCEALRTYYGLQRDEAYALIAKATFIHPYGTVGFLDWQDRDGISFGAEIGGQKLLQISNQLRTFTEQVQDENAQGGIAEAMTEAETVIFLGFAFHEQNLKLLAPGLIDFRRAFATAYKMSKSDCEVIKKQIQQIHFEDLDMVIRSDVTCVDLFEQYWRSFRAESD